MDENPYEAPRVEQTTETHRENQPRITWWVSGPRRRNQRIGRSGNSGWPTADGLRVGAEQLRLSRELVSLQVFG